MAEMFLSKQILQCLFNHSYLCRASLVVQMVESAHNAGDLGSVPGMGGSLAGGHGNLLQYSYLETPMDRGTWRATVHGVAESWTRLTDTLSV